MSVKGNGGKSGPQTRVFNNLPVILAASTAIIAGLYGYANRIPNSRVYQNMCLFLIVFYIIGTLLKNTLNSLREELAEKDEAKPVAEELLIKDESVAAIDMQAPVNGGGYVDSVYMPEAETETETGAGAGTGTSASENADIFAHSADGLAEGADGGYGEYNEDADGEYGEFNEYADANGDAAFEEGDYRGGVTSRVGSN